MRVRVQGERQPAAAAVLTLAAVGAKVGVEVGPAVGAALGADVGAAVGAAVPTVKTWPPGIPG